MLSLTRRLNSGAAASAAAWTSSWVSGVGERPAPLLHTQLMPHTRMPQCRAALYSIAILVFIDYWNMVEQPLILLPDASQQPLSVYLSQINAGEIGIAFAAAVVYMVPGLLMFLHGEAYLVEGITYAGSVKG